MYEHRLEFTFYVKKTKGPGRRQTSSRSDHIDTRGDCSDTHFRRTNTGYEPLLSTPCSRRSFVSFSLLDDQQVSRGTKEKRLSDTPTTFTSTSKTEMKVTILTSMTTSLDCLDNQPSVSYTNFSVTWKSVLC